MSSTKIIDAEYVVTHIDEFDQNPCLAALVGKCLDEKQFKNYLDNLSPNIELENVTEQKYLTLFNSTNAKKNENVQVFTSLSYYVYTKIFTLIVASYRNRNPRSEEFQRFVNKVASYSIQQELAMPDCKTQASFIICGETGVGKTTILNNALSCIPQVINHSEFKGQPFHFKQLNYVKFDSARSVATRGQIERFFYAVDQALGTDYSIQHQKCKDISILTSSIRKIIAIHAIGLIVLDEAQNLSSKTKEVSNGGSINFIETLFNSCGSAFVTISTTGGLAGLMSKSELSRRFTEDGIVYIKPYKKGSRDFTIILNKYLSVYGLSVDPQFDATFRDHVFEYTQGVADYIKKLVAASFEVCQQKHVTVVNPRVLRMIAENFREVMQKQIEIIKKGHVIKGDQSLQTANESIKALDLTLNKAVPLVQLNLADSHKVKAGQK
jgi:hypothetical protein